MNHTTWARFNYDLHQATGAYALVVLFAVLASGTALFNLRAEFHWVVRLFSPTVDRYSVRSRPPDGRPAISIAEAVRAATAHRMPGGSTGCTRRQGPSAHTQYVAASEARAGSLGGCVVVDKYTGDILHVAGPAEGTGGDRFIHLEWFLHSGQVAGLFGRILVLLSGLVCPSSS